MKLVIDTGALLSLACSRYFSILLNEHQFIITRGVADELAFFAQYNDFLGTKAQELQRHAFKKEEPITLLSLNLEKAETEVFSLAHERRYLAITDDVHAARVAAEKIKLVPKPSFYLLLPLYHKKKITKQELTEDIQSILVNRNWLSGALWEYALELIEKLEE